MHSAKPIQWHGQAVNTSQLPLVCTPLVGATPNQLLAELATVLAKKPDMLEWRVDFFRDIANSAEVVRMAHAIKAAAGPLPLLFTRRSIREGGEPIALTEDEVVDLYETVCQAQCADLIDFEMGNDANHIARLRQVSRTHHLQLVLSFHNFSATPSQPELAARFEMAQQLGADVAKIAVMPQHLDDVLTLLSATLQASQTLPIPVVSMSMGPYGSLTRLFGFAFGSALSFAVGASSSAPGQVPIEDLQTVLAIVKKSMVVPG